MIFGTSENVKVPLKALFLTSDPPNYSKEFNKKQKLILVGIRILKSQELKKREYRKDVCREKLEIGLIK